MFESSTPNAICPLILFPQLVPAVLEFSQKQFESSVEKPLKVQLLTAKQHLKHVEPLPGMSPKVLTRPGSKSAELKSASDSFMYFQQLSFAQALPKIPANNSDLSLSNAVYGFNPVHRAVVDGCPVQLQLAMDAGFDLDAITFAGETPLHLAVAARNTSLARLLLEQGANPLILDNSGLPARRMSVTRRLDEIVALIDKKSIGFNLTLPTPAEKLSLYKFHRRLGIEAVHFVHSKQFISFNRAVDAVSGSLEHGLRRSFICALRPAPGSGYVKPSVRAAQRFASANRIGVLAKHLQAKSLPMYGNCSEMAQLALWFLSQKAQHPRLELATLDAAKGVLSVTPAILGNQEIKEVYPDHTFLVLGRNALQSNPCDPETWCFSTVICDPWSGRVYSANEIQEEMGLLAQFSGRETKTCILTAVQAKV